MTIKENVQQLEPGAQLTFWILDATGIGGGAVRFHGHNDDVLTWQGQEYAPFPISGEGFSRTSDQQPQPKLLVGNVDGSITRLCMDYEDLVGATITRKRTFQRYLDAINFKGPNLAAWWSYQTDPDTPGSASVAGDEVLIGNSAATTRIYYQMPTEIGEQYAVEFEVYDNEGATRAGTFYSGTNLLPTLATSPGRNLRTFTATSENSFVMFIVSAISSGVPMRLRGFKVCKLLGNPTANPSEELLPELWFIERKAAESREAVEFELSSALNFMGHKLPGRPIQAGQCPAQWVYRGENCMYDGPPVADINDVPTTDPLLDRCGKRFRSCQLRIWPDGVLNYGGFVAAGLVRT